MLPLLCCLLAAFAEEPDDLELLREPPGPMTKGYRPEWVIRHRSGSAMGTEQFFRITDGMADYRRFEEEQKKTLTNGVLLGVAGGASYLLGAGLAGYGAATEREGAIVAGAGVGLVGSVGFTLGAVSVFTKHSRRRKHPAEFLTATEADRLIGSYNSGLGLEEPAPTRAEGVPRPSPKVVATDAEELELTIRVDSVGSGGLTSVSRLQGALERKEGALLRCFPGPGEVDGTVKLEKSGATSDVDLSGTDEACVAKVLRTLVTQPVDRSRRLTVTVRAE